METESLVSDLRIASFAVYLNPGDDSFVKKLMESTQHPSSPAPLIAKDGEIGVFGAEKYFNMNLDDSIKSPSLVSADHGRTPMAVNKENPLSDCTPNVRKGTPSMTSESSWTTQSTFLKSFKRSLSQNKVRSADQRGFFAGLSCYKSCNDRKSIYTVQQDTNIGNVMEGAGSRKKMAAGRDDQFLRSSRTVSKRVMEQPFSFPAVKESSRPSLEVFRLNPNTSHDIVAMNLERKLSVLTWDAIPTTTQVIIPTKSGSVRGLEEDLISEASSDLFEIDNISAAGSMAPCMYAPSEASIEWSVVTASAADFSDYNLNHRGIHPFHLIPGGSKVNERGDQKGRQSGLLGCKNYKAVEVAKTTVCRASPKYTAA